MSKKRRGIKVDLKDTKNRHKDPIRKSREVTITNLKKGRKKRKKEETKKIRIDNRILTDDIHTVDRLKVAMNSHEIKFDPIEFINTVSGIKNDDFLNESLRLVSSENQKGYEILAAMDENQLRYWANSLGKEGRALELENIRAMGIPFGRNVNHPLRNARRVLLEVFSDYDLKQEGSGVGSPGFTRDNVDMAQEVYNSELLHQYIYDQILGAEGERVRNLNRNEPTDANKLIAGKMIRKMVYPDALLGEVHAIGLGNDVLAASWVNGLRHAASYSDIAKEIDSIVANQFNGDRIAVAKIIAQYAGLEEGVPELTQEQNEAAGPKLREFATIQIAERGRELARIREAGGVVDKNFVRTALESAGRQGFHTTYVTQTTNYAPFAAPGGQENMRRVYNANQE